MDYEFHTKPFKHQFDAFMKTRDLSDYAIFWEQGCGKSKLVIDTACYLYEQGKIDAVLIVAPSGVHKNWLTDELPQHMPTRLRGKTKAEVWESSKAKNKSTLLWKKSLLENSGFSWLFISYDGFMPPLGRAYVASFLRGRKCLYVLDEAHNIKNPAAKRTVSILASGKYALFRRILTGTPISKGPFDIYTQMKFLQEDFWAKNKFPNFHLFKFYFGQWYTKEQRLRETGYSVKYDELVGFKNLDHLQKIIDSKSDRITKESAGLDLPPKLYSKRFYELSPLQKRLYRDLEADMAATMDDGSNIDGKLAVTRLLRFQQIICGYVKTEEEEPLKLLEDRNPRLDALDEVIQETFHPAIIWARFTKDIDQIMGLLGEENAVRYDGTLSPDEALANKEKFQRGDVQYFVATPQKGGTGLTLTRAKTVIFYSNSFRLIDRLQAEDRAHRIGQDTPVTYIDIVCKNTVDEHIVRSLREKFDIATQITGDKLKEWI